MKILKKNNERGVSLGELLAVVAIVVILLAVAIPSVILIQRNLRQKELDAKAETIYLAVQNRLTELYTGGRADVYDPQSYSDNSIKNFGNFPSDYDPDGGTSLNEDSVYFFTSGENEASKAIVTKDVLDDELLGNHWVVELVPYAYREHHDDEQELTAGFVYGVFYSEEKVNVAEKYDADTNADSDYRGILRDRSSRLKKGARVGYYGGAGVGAAGAVTSLTVDTVKIHSEEEILTATVKCRKPSSVADPLLFTFTLTDGEGKDYVFCYNEENHQFRTENGLAYNKGNVTVRHVGQSYEFTIVLDDLSSEETRFYRLYGSEPDEGLVCGSSLTLEAKVECPKDLTAGEDSKSDTGNSLFSGKSEEDTAVLTCARHLQNLDESSRVTEKITKARQENNISFAEDSPWYAEYEDQYFHGKTAVTRLTSSGTKHSSAPNFKPIDNEHLTVFDGKTGDGSYGISELTVSAKEQAPAGLFGTVTQEKLSLNNVVLTGARISSKSGSAGALVGAVRGNSQCRVTISDCRVYLSKDQGDIPVNLSKDANAEAVRWILGGQSAGGLVGMIENAALTIESSSAATVLGDKVCGGILGTAGKKSSVTLKESYGDCYLYGDRTGGLIGQADENGKVFLESCYAAGFIGLSDQTSSGAGLVNGKAESVKNSYTILACYRQAADRGIDKVFGKIDTSTKGSYYSVCKDAMQVQKVYYFNGSSSNEWNIKGAECLNAMTSEELKNQLGQAFVIDTIGTQPYRLMGQSLTTYTYPRLKELAHYGDWETTFQSGALVYYEKYQSGSVGFDGAGVDVSLSGEETIIGDGYGVVFREGTSLPSKVTVQADGREVMSFSPSAETSYETVTRTEEAGTVTYRIYPLPKDVVNPSAPVSGFYSRICILQTAGNESSGSYFDYNPHFARTVQEVTSADAPVSAIEPMISIRSPRHLYDLSLYYDMEGTDGYRTIAEGKTYVQERDVIYSSYEWEVFTTESSPITSQQPIGKTGSGSFRDVYDGGCFLIGDVSFISERGRYLGMFGCTDRRSELKNIVIAADYDKADGSKNYRVSRTEPARANDTLYYGILTGRNQGTIDNCAVAGYDLSGRKGTVHGYANSHIYLGGLAGLNEGEIRNSSADCPRMDLSTYRTTCYAGGFVGFNEGSIRNCYDLNHIDAIANGGNTIIAGFAAVNSGTIRQSYCATALTASGSGVHSYGFAASEGGGSTASCYYLHAGSYQFVDGLYAYETTSERGTKRTYQQMVDMNNNPARNSYFHKNTTALNGRETDYPYRAVVTDRNGSPVHYGEWQTKPGLGTLGIFYWEKEEHGENNGYKLTYIGTSEGVSQYQTTLCTSHDDGGVITSYGYGYYLLSGEEDHVTYHLDGIATGSIDHEGNGSAAKDKEADFYNREAAEALGSQLPGYTFYPFTTGNDTGQKDYICLSGQEANGTWTLTYDNKHSYEYALSPFFANAMQFKNANPGSSFEVTDSAGYTTKYAEEPGSSKNTYEVRSAEQLQYINWSFETKDTSQLVDKENYKNFNYLMYATVTGKGKQTLANAGNNQVRNWRQSHDMDASSITNYTPIAGQTKASDNNAYNAILYAWFGGNYDGDSYKISELSIDSKSATVGMFGVTVGGVIKNIILYSKDGDVIQRRTENTDTLTSYAIGGMIGVAYQYEGEKEGVISNCAIAGYRIEDNSENPQGKGEANVGGLIGVSNVRLEKCSAVTELAINCTHPKKDGKTGITTAAYGNYVRMGGIVGAAQFSLTDCYSGGSIRVSEKTLDENYNKDGNHVEQELKDWDYLDPKNVVNDQKSTNLYLAGIAGSGFAMNYQNFTNETLLKEGSPEFTNCYTFMEFPAYEGTIRSIALMGSLADRYGEGRLVTIKNCYYLEESANIDVSKAPAFKMTLGGKRVSELIRSKDLEIDGKETYFQNMLSGDSRYVQKMYHISMSKKLQGVAPTSKTYEELSQPAMVEALNQGGNVWNPVTTVDASGGSIDGKYSFPGSVIFLDGKNYPFPTVIRQKDLTFGNDVFVHYGRWPSAGARWEKGTDTMDIFNQMEALPEDAAADDRFAYKEFLFEICEEPGLDNLTKEDFLVDHPEIAKIESVVREDQNYVVKLCALKNGTVTVTEKNSQASFVLEITADLRVSASPEQMLLANGKEETLTLKAVSPDGKRDYSAGNNGLTWTVTPSKDSSLDGDVKVEREDDYAANKNIYTVTGYGFDAVINIKAEYNYHGIIFDGSAVALVRRPGVVGLAKDLTYNEAQIAESGTVSGQNVSYPQESPNRPKDETGASFFLYDTASAELLENYVEGRQVTIELKAVSKAHEELKIEHELSTGLTETAGSDFHILTGQLYYETTDTVTEQQLSDVTLTAAIQKEGGAAYTLTLDGLTANALQPIRVILHQNPPEGAQGSPGGQDPQEITEILKDWYADRSRELPQLPKNFSVTGYEFLGWNTKADGTGIDYTPGKKAAFSTDTDLYARWSKAKTLTLMNGEKPYLTVPDGAVITDPVYQYQKPEKSDCILTGWYTGRDMENSQKVLNADGTIVRTVPGYTNDGKVSLSQDQTLYACWLQKSEVWVRATELKEGGRYLIVNAGSDQKLIALCQEKPADTLAVGQKLLPLTGVELELSVRTYYDEQGNPLSLSPMIDIDNDTIQEKFYWNAKLQNSVMTLCNVQYPGNFLAENDTQSQTNENHWAIGAVSAFDKLSGNKAERAAFLLKNGHLVSGTGGPVYFAQDMNDPYMIYGEKNLQDQERFTYLMEQKTVYVPETLQAAN